MVSLGCGMVAHMTHSAAPGKQHHDQIAGLILGEQGRASRSSSLWRVCSVFGGDLLPLPAGRRAVIPQGPPGSRCWRTADTRPHGTIGSYSPADVEWNLRI